eukprot:5630423-Pyramimonas_sp.AAC.1
MQALEEGAQRVHRREHCWPLPVQPPPPKERTEHHLLPGLAAPRSTAPRRCCTWNLRRAGSRST